jgi:hypothetical protein
MPNFEATIPSTWTRERTFDYLADFRSVAEWDPSMQSATLVAGQPGEVGARYELVMSTLGRETTLVYEAVEVQRPERFVMRCETDSLVSVDTITVAEDAAVTYDAQLDLKGLKKVADPAMQVGLVLASERAKHSLEEKLATP